VSKFWESQAPQTKFSLSRTRFTCYNLTMKWLIIFVINMLLALLFFENSSFLDGLNDDKEIIFVVMLIDAIFIYPIAITIGAIIYSLFFNDELKEDLENHEMAFGYTFGLIVMWVINLFTSIAPSDPIGFLILTSLPALFLGAILLGIFV